MRIKTILKYISVGVFLYIAFFSIQNFYQGYHDLDIAFNFLNLGMSGDFNTDGSFVMLTDTYLRGLSRITTSFVWFCFDCILGVYIGMMFKGGVQNG